MTILLKDDYNETIDGIITAEHTTADELQEIIYRVKNEEKPGEWTYEDIQDALPDDCSIEWIYDCHEVVYC